MTSPRYDEITERVVEHGGLRIRVRELVTNGSPTVTAELSVIGAPRERALVEVRAPEELAAATQTFAASAGLRLAGDR